VISLPVVPLAPVTRIIAVILRIEEGKHSTA
jgi:hypothetical protein